MYKMYTYNFLPKHDLDLINTKNDIRMSFNFETMEKIYIFIAILWPKHHKHD